MKIRKIPTKEQLIYLTFDDGPDPEQTPLVLEVLQKHQVPATFFLIAKKAQQQPELIHQMQLLGHRIGNHSLDHQYKVFFKGEMALVQWIEEADSIFQELGVKDTCGFRSPVGIRTPELSRALQKLNRPLILWNVRFYDSTWKWTQRKAARALQKMEPGSIILLHDVQKPRNRKVFLETLDFFLQAALERGFRFRTLPSWQQDFQSLENTARNF